MDVFHDALKSGKRQKLLILNSYPFHHVILSFIFVYFTMPEAIEDSLDRDVKGVFLAQGCIMMMALLTIFLGSFRSLQHNHTALLCHQDFLHGIDQYGTFCRMLQYNHGAPTSGLVHSDNQPAPPLCHQHFGRSRILQE
jgi:hypothetical protein